MNIPIDKENTIKACLLHDMGNIVKFKLGYFPETLEPEGIEYWTKVQEEYVSKYGNDDHHATLAILKELNIDSDVIDLVNCIGFHTAEENMNSADFNRKICAYADMRVIPHGVSSLEERLSNLRERYTNIKPSVNNTNLGNGEERKLFEDSLMVIERQIFENCSIKPKDINDLAIKDRVEKLQNHTL
jgi:hypothetical protein